MVLSGSCSVMTNSQVAAYRQQAPARAVDLSACFTDLESYVRTLTDWVDAQRDAPLAPMIYATTEPQTLQRIQAQYGDKASSERVEQLFAALAAALKANGFTRFIVAGGETSSIVAQTLGVEAFHIGVLGIFRPKTTKCSGGPAVCGLQRGITFSLTGKYPSIERISSSRSGNFSLNSKW
ncbi:YgbK domain protein [Klebsiella pneumoniae 540_1460]|nr:YgbK domain protein [Klebsiella pneumoniae 540_1460]